MQITDAGRRLYAELFPQLAAINERLMAVLTEREAEVLQELLERLTHEAERIKRQGDGIDERADRRHGGSRVVWERRTRLD